MGDPHGVGRSEWTPAQSTPTSSDHAADAEAADAEAAEAAHGAVIREHAPRASGESGVVADREPLAAWVRDVSGLEAVAGGKVPVQPPSRHLDQNAGAEAAVGHHGPRQDARRGRRQEGSEGKRLGLGLGDTCVGRRYWENHLQK